MKEVTECKSGLFIFSMKVRNFTARLVGGCAGGCHCTPPAWTTRKMFVPLNGPHAGNVLMLEDGRLGLIDYGAVMRLGEELRTNIARLIVAIADNDDDSVPRHMWACGF